MYALKNGVMLACCCFLEQLFWLLFRLYIMRMRSMPNVFFKKIFFPVLDTFKGLCKRYAKLAKFEPFEVFGNSSFGPYFVLKGITVWRTYLQLRLELIVRLQIISKI